LAIATTMLIASGVATPVRAETADAVLGAPAASSASPVTDWNQIALTTLMAFPPPASGAPPALQVNLGMVQGAVYDAINAIEPRHRPYLLETQFAPTASKEAAVATAAYRVLSSIISTVPASIAFPNRASPLEAVETA
jgi:hypothetical protein